MRTTLQVLVANHIACQRDEDPDITRITIISTSTETKPAKRRSDLDRSRTHRPKCKRLICNNIWMQSRYFVFTVNPCSSKIYYIFFALRIIIDTTTWTVVWRVIAVCTRAIRTNWINPSRRQPTQPRLAAQIHCIRNDKRVAKIVGNFHPQATIRRNNICIDLSTRPVKYSLQMQMTVSISRSHGII